MWDILVTFLITGTKMPDTAEGGGVYSDSGLRNFCPCVVGSEAEDHVEGPVWSRAGHLMVDRKQREGRRQGGREALLGQTQ